MPPSSPSDPPSGTASSPAVARLAELANAAPLALWLFSEEGAFLAQNDVARAAFGASALEALFASSEAAASILDGVREHGDVTGEAELVTERGKLWCGYRARRTIDPATLAPAVSLSAEDLTERRGAERAKDELISVVSHELRTPLTAIRGAIGLLANNVAEDDRQKEELFDIAWENIRRLSRLVDDLLDVQRLRLGAVDLVLATIELSALVSETLDLLSLTAEEAGLALRLEPACEGPLWVSADAGRVVQALSNLVTNAIKHAPIGTAVTVSIEERKAAIRVNVRDRGAGVPTAFVPSLFAPFSQADSTDSRARGGAGLGLYIVRTLIEAHRGTVGYEPAEPGGSVFYFELPKASEAPAPDSAPRSVLPRAPRQ